MSTPFSISGAFSYPADASLPADQIALAASGSFDHEASAVLKLTGTGTKTVDMGTIPAAGAKAFLVKLDAGSGVSPILVTLNGGTEPLEIAAGGFILVSNPAPVAGVTDMSIAYTTPCTVRVWALG